MNLQNANVQHTNHPYGEGNQASLSNLGKSLNALEPDSVERNEKLEELRMAVAQGSYNVDAGAVAVSLLEDP